MTDVSTVGLHQPEPGGPESQPPGTEQKEVSHSLWADGWRELRVRPLFWVSILVVLVVTSMALFPGLWASGDPEQCLLQRGSQGPSAAHPFGFTFQGCDMWAKVVYGTSKSLAVGLIATIATTLFGMLFGIFAGYFPGIVDSVLSRFTDVFFGIPFILGAVVFLAVIPERNVYTISAVLAVLSWPTFTRIMRGSVLGTKNRDFVDAARALGARNIRII